MAILYKYWGEKANCITDPLRLASWRRQENRLLLTRSEKVIWLFFAATSIQLAFLQPYVTLVPGERTNLFSGLLCLLSGVVLSQPGGILPLQTNPSII